MTSRDAKARNTEAIVAAVDSFGLTGFSYSASHFEHAMTWDGDEKYPEESYGDVDEVYSGHEGGSLFRWRRSGDTLWTTQNSVNSLAATWMMLKRQQVHATARRGT